MSEPSVDGRGPRYSRVYLAARRRNPAGEGFNQDHLRVTCLRGSKLTNEPSSLLFNYGYSGTATPGSRIPSQEVSDPSAFQPLLQALIRMILNHASFAPTPVASITRGR
jgi:hypothetical protein